jgi:hypothetical protein
MLLKPHLRGQLWGSVHSQDGGAVGLAAAAAVTPECTLSNAPVACVLWVGALGQMEGQLTGRQCHTHCVTAAVQPNLKACMVALCPCQQLLRL